MTNMVRAEIRSIDVWRLAALFGSARLLGALWEIVGSALNITEDPLPPLFAQAVVSPIAWGLIGAILALGYNGLSQIFGGISLELGQRLTYPSLSSDTIRPPERTQIEWSYFDDDGQQVGPYDGEAFRKIISDGLIQAETKVSRAVRNLTTELILEDKVRGAYAYSELTSILRKPAPIEED